MNKKKIFLIIVTFAIAFLVFGGYMMYNKHIIRKINRAIEEGNVERVSKLMSSCNNINDTPYSVFFASILEKENASPLNNACFLGEYEIVKVLIEHGADTNYRKTQTENTPLMNALVGSTQNKPDRFKIGEYLLEHGADVNLVSANGHTAVFDIISIVESEDVEEQQEQVRMIKLFEEYGCDIYYESSIGNLLFECCSCGNKLAIEYLIEEKCFNVNSLNSSGDNALMYTIKHFYRNQYEIVELLINYGISLETINNDGLNATELAKKNGDSMLIQLIEKNQ